MLYLSCEHVYKEFKQGTKALNVLHDVSVQFEQGTTYAIMGVSGTGKSTLMHILAGLDEPTKGIIQFDGHNLATLNVQERSVFLNKSIGLMFQWPYLIKELSVLENVMMPGLLAEKPADLCEQHAHELLIQIGLGHKMNAKPATLSGGQQQRVALARALFNKPAFLLADEPTGNLDIKTGKEMVEVLLACKKRYNMGLIISTHDHYVAESMQVHYELRNGILEEI